MISQLAGAGHGGHGDSASDLKPWLNQKPQETANFHGKSMGKYGKIWENEI